MPQQRATSGLGCLHRARGWILMLSATAIGLIGGYVLSLLASSLQQDPEQARAVGPFVTWMTAHRTAVPLLAIPPFACGVWLALVSSRRAGFWMVWVLATLWAFALFAAVFIAFILFMAPLYTYQPI